MPHQHQTEEGAWEDANRTLASFFTTNWPDSTDSDLDDPDYIFVEEPDSPTTSEDNSSEDSSDGDSSDGQDSGELGELLGEEGDGNKAGYTCQMPLKF